MHILLTYSLHNNFAKVKANRNFSIGQVIGTRFIFIEGELGIPLSCPVCDVSSLIRSLNLDRKLKSLSYESPNQSSISYCAFSQCGQYFGFVENRNVVHIYEVPNIL